MKRLAAASLILLAACDSNVTYQTSAPVDSVMTSTNRYSMQHGLKLGYQAAERWVRADDSARHAAARGEAQHLMQQTITPALAACLGDGFPDALEAKLYAGLDNPALYNAMAAEWYNHYSDAQLDNIHAVAMRGGSIADLDTKLFPAGSAPTAASLAAAPRLAAQKPFAEPKPLTDFITSWMTQHSQPHCPIPANEPEWQQAISYESFYAPRGATW